MWVWGYKIAHYTGGFGFICFFGLGCFPVCVLSVGRGFGPHCLHGMYVGQCGCECGVCLRDLGVAWSFTAFRFCGYIWAYSNPHQYLCFDLLEKLKSASRRESKYKDNVEFIHAIAKNVRSVIKELNLSDKEFLFDNPEEKQRLPETEFGRSVVTIINFTLISDSTWGLVYSPNDYTRME